MKFSIVIATLTGCSGALLESMYSEAATEKELQTQAIQSMILEGKHKHSHHVKTVIDKAIHKFKDYDKLKLPHDIQALLSSRTRGENVELDEGAITKARKILNQMMESAQDELDAKTMTCKEFHERNRQTWAQVSTDLKRLSTQIADLEGVKQESTSEIAKATEFVNDIEEQRQAEQLVYDDIRRVDEEEMVWRKNDLRVAEFLLKLTKCKGKGKGKSMLIQLENQSSPLQVKRCLKDDEKTGKRHHSIRFMNKHLRVAMLSMGKHGKKAVSRALLAATTEPTADGPPAGEMPGGPPPSASRGNSQPASARKQSKKCSLGRPNCGLLHDNMSLMWGEMKDAVDKLDSKMRKEEKAWNKKLDNWNDQISLATGNKETSQGHLSGAIAEQTSDQAEQDKKEQEERRLEDEFAVQWGACVAEIEEILFTKFCGVKSARGELHKKSAEVRPDDLIDCETADWIAQACSVPCDDNLVGGTQTLTREVVQMNNTYGVNCPALTWVKKCNEVPCPVDCQQSNWSRWSACTADCGGGVMGRSRTIEVRPSNGGVFCDVPTEVTSCHTGSCDRKCDLTPWKMRPCSVSCGGGYLVRKKHVTRPARGKGKCPKKRSRKRYGKKRCNRHDCYGDEECLAKQDVVIAIDGSGSMKDKGFKVLKEFAASLVEHFRGKAEEWVEDEETGEEMLATVTAVQAAIVQFGNGVLGPNNTVSGANIVSGLNNDTAATAGQIRELEWQRGFTNMAQAFSAADTVFLNGGRQHAQSIVIVISDGKPSFNFQTENAVKKLRRKGTKVVMVVVKEFLKEEQKELMKSWSSVPRNTNFIHVPGLKELKDHNEHWVNHVVIRSCSKTISLKKEKEEQDMWEAASAMEDLAEYTEETKQPAFLSMTE